MASIDDVREIALSLPGVEERIGGHTGAPTWRAKSGQFVWIRGPRQTDLRQLEELGRAWPEVPVLVIRVSDLAEKEAMLAAEPDALFTIPHFDGYPAVLARLDGLDRERLAELVCDAWVLRAPASVARAWLAERGLS